MLWGIGVPRCPTTLAGDIVQGHTSHAEPLCTLCFSATVCARKNAYRNLQVCVLETTFLFQWTSVKTSLFVYDAEMIHWVWDQEKDTYKKALAASFTIQIISRILEKIPFLQHIHWCDPFTPVDFNPYHCSQSQSPVTWGKSMMIKSSMCRVSEMATLWGVIL